MMRLLSDRLSELYHLINNSIKRYGFAEITPEFVNYAFGGQLHHREMYFPMGPTWPESGNPQKDFREWLPIQGFRLINRPEQRYYKVMKVDWK